MRKKEGLRTYQGQYRDKASPSFRWDGDKGSWDLLFLRRDHDRGAMWDFFLRWDCDKGGWDHDWRGCSRGTAMSSSSGGSRWRPCGTGTSSSSGGTTTVMGCDSKTSSSPTCMCFTLGTSSSSSLMCAMPNSSFIISNVICTKRNIPK
jgi:hypothetical protein